jgi:GTP-sensing pleiotropic transcriptional regulator CodY
MSAQAALITALIVDRPLCLSCIADKSGVTVERVSEALHAIGSALVLTSRNDHCTACGTTTTAYAVARPPLE